MIYRFSKTNRQLIAVGLLFAIVAVLALGIAWPLVASSVELSDSIEAERSLLGRLQRVVDQSSANTEDPAKTIATSDLFIKGGSDSIRIATLQSELSAILAANGVKPRSARALPNRTRDDLKLVGVQLQIISPVAQLQKIMLDIERHKPALFISSLQITPSSMTGLPNEDDKAALDARLDVLAVEAPL